MENTSDYKRPNELFQFKRVQLTSDEIPPDYYTLVAMIVGILSVFTKVLLKNNYSKNI